MSQNWPKLPYEWAHSLNDAYDELKALKEDTEQEIEELATHNDPADKARLRELQTIAERVGLGLGPVGYVLFHGDSDAVRLHPEMKTKYGQE